MPVAARKPARSRSLAPPCRPAPNRISRSPTRIWPRSGFSSRLMQRKRVDLPEPEGPISATTAPRSTCNDTPFSTSTRPNDFHRSAISIIASNSEQENRCLKVSESDAGDFPTDNQPTNYLDRFAKTYKSWNDHQNPSRKSAIRDGGASYVGIWHSNLKT